MILNLPTAPPAWATANKATPVITQSRIAPRPLRIRQGAAFEIPIAEGAPDTHTIIAYLDSFIVRYGRMPAIRRAALDILGDAGNHDQPEQLRRLGEFVLVRVRYVLDPVDSEFIVSPIRLLDEIRDRGFASGDCDDHVLLLGALAASVGIRGRAVGVHISPGSKRFDHVVNLFDIAGETILFDSCRKHWNPIVNNDYQRLLVSGHA